MPTSTPLSLTHHKLILCKLFYNFYIIVHKNRTGDMDMQEKIWEVLESEKECEGGVTQLVQGDLAVRILGHRAQKLQETAEEIKAIFEEVNNNNR